MGIGYKLKEGRSGVKPFLHEVKFTLKRIRKSPLSIVGIIIITVFLLIAVLAPVLAPPVDTDDPYSIFLDGYGPTPRDPGSEVLDSYVRSKGWTTHYLGTAEGQFDIYYGCIWGTRTAFQVGAMVVVISLIIGLVAGCVAGFYRGIIDEILMRFTDVILAFPGLVFSMALVVALPPTWILDLGVMIIAVAIFVAALIVSRLIKLSSALMFLFAIGCAVAFAAAYIFVLGNPATMLKLTLNLSNLDKVLIALALVGWPGYTRVIRGEVLRVRQEDYVEAAKAVGCSDFRIVAKHILPNTIYPVLIMASLDIGGVVLTAAALSFLGIGAPAGYADWGQMIAFARNWIWAGFENPWQYWYTFTIPGVFIFLFVLGFNLLGDAFRDILDPTLRRR